MVMILRNLHEKISLTDKRLYYLFRINVKFNMNQKYLDRKMSIRNNKELRDRLLLRSAQLDFSRLAKDLEPFVNSKKEVDRVLMFPDFVRQAI